MNLKEMLNRDFKDYKSIPFWSWNDRLEPDELRRQIRLMNEAGIGGFFMHARGGLQTEYMGEEWFAVTKACIEEAKKQNMNAWAYDENGWPSGFAGMKLLEDSANWAHYLQFETRDCFDDSALAVYHLDNHKLIRLEKQTENVTEYICIYDKTNSTVVDVLNKAVVAKFINETHEKYYERFQEDFGTALLGFFTDEPQYFRWGTAYTPVILDEYKKEYGEDILDTLGALFVDCEQAYELRFQYWRLMNKLYIDAFAKQVYEWCEAHHCKLTGHTIEEPNLFSQMWCCAGVMPFYEYEHIPGIDWLGRKVGTEMPPKQVSSVAQQLGKKQVLTETFACTGWDITPMELKRIAEWQYVNGVNLMCQHLYPYSIRGQRKRDYPAFFSEHNMWTKEFKHFNDYFTLLGFMLAESREVAKVGIIHPMHSAYLTYNREKDYLSIRDVEDDFKELIEKFAAANIGHHYIDELLLEKHGKVNKNKLTVGLCDYEFIVIPKMNNLDKSTAKLLEEYIGNGGKTYLAGERPQFVGGKKADLSYLKSNTTFEELINGDVVISDMNTEIRSTFRNAEFGKFIFAVNLSEDRDYSVDFAVRAKGAKLFDLERREEKALYFESADEGIKIPLYFKAGQSFVIMLDDSAISAKKEKSADETISLDTNVSIVSGTENALTIDYAQISYDNITFEEKMPVMAISDRLLKERRNGKVFLKYTFHVKEIPETIFVETEKMNTSNIWFNDELIEISDQGRLDRSFVRKDIKAIVKKGLNEIVFELNYYQSEHVYYVMFDVEEGTEGLMNCLTFDTDIEAIYILGDFAVDSENGYWKGEKNTSIAKGDFFIAKSDKKIDAAKVNLQGYPFFAGEFTIEKKFYVSKTDYKLRLTGRFALVKIEVNGNFAGMMMFDHVCDISQYLKIGENSLTIKLFNSNRNLLGPFHVKGDAEPYFVTPRTFDMYGTWVNGESSDYSADYAFVHFGITDIELI